MFHFDLSFSYEFLDKFQEILEKFLVLSRIEILLPALSNINFILGKIAL